MQALVVLVLVAARAALVLCSYGDVEPGFRRCVSDCLQRTPCSEESLSAEQRALGPVRAWLASFVSRTCDERCEYACMMRITRERLSRGQAVYKYHGHWAFERYWGLEEPASVVFSLANGLPHLHQLWLPGGGGGGGGGVPAVQDGRGRRRTTAATGGYFMAPYLAAYPVVALTAWVSSAFFHAKKTPHSTLVDYCTALVFLAYGLWLTLRRALGPRAHGGVVAGLLGGGAALVAWRLDCMRRGRVSYDEHMHLCIAIAVATIALWAAWIAAGGGGGGGWVGNKRLPNCLPFPLNRFRCLACQVAFAAASLLELFDFPPLWGCLDAHSLWHLATIPLGFVWYTFWAQDSANLLALQRAEAVQDDKMK